MKTSNNPFPEDYANPIVKLFKSRLLSSIHCPKRAHLEVQDPELTHYSPAAETAFANRHCVCEKDIEVRGGPEDQRASTYIDFDGGNRTPALHLTRGL